MANSSKYTGKLTKKTPEKAARTPKTAEKPREIVENPPENTENNANNANLFSISALSRKFKLDRATIRERLEKNEIKPHSVKSNEKLYLLEDVEFILLQSELNEAKFRKLDAEAELKELEVKKKLGEFASVAEFTEIVQRMMSGFYSKTVIQMPARIASRLHNANNTADVAEILKSEMIKEWKNLRDHYPDYIKIK